MKKYLLALLPVLVLSFGSCKKDPPDLTGTTVVDNPGGSTGNPTPGNPNPGSTANDSYLPTTTGTSWTYQNNLSGTTKNVESHVTGVITPINGENYYEVKSATPGNENFVQYNYVKDKKYKIVSTTEQEKVTEEFFILDDNLDVGDEWTAKMSPSGLVNGVPARTQTKIVEKGITKTVLNKTYKNVIHTHMKVQYDFGSGFQDFGDYDYYLAKGIGMIQTDAGFSGFTSSTYLYAYTIK